MPGGIALPPIPVLVPIGGIAAWLKSYTNTPALPSGWVECNGQTLSDPESVYNGQIIPDLNGDNRFLRGNATTGGTGGEETHALTSAEIPDHQHYSGITQHSGSSGNCWGATPSEFVEDIVTLSDLTGDAHNNLPPYYDVVWIMRVK